VHLVSFTVDPKTDTPEVLRDYAERLHAAPARWDFLTGPVETIYSLTQNGFKLAVAESGDEPGVPVHSTRAVLVDRRGTIRGYYDMTAPDGLTKLLADTSHLLREQPK
jgi:protein SCO1/2